MKNRSHIYSLFMAVAVAILLLGSCSGSKKEEAGEQQHQDGMENDMKDAPAADGGYAVEPAFKEQLGNAFTEYVALKDAFVASDEAGVLEEADDLKEALSKVDMTLLKGEAHMNWMEYLDGMETALIEIAGSNDIEAQRGAFSMLSNNLYTSVRMLGVKDRTVYYQFCPMAFENAGAYWLSDEEKIRNPYFGDKMLTCGSVKETIR